MLSLAGFFVKGDCEKKEVKHRLGGSDAVCTARQGRVRRSMGLSTGAGDGCGPILAATSSALRQPSVDTFFALHHNDEVSVDTRKEGFGPRLAVARFHPFCWRAEP